MLLMRRRVHRLACARRCAPTLAALIGARVVQGPSARACSPSARRSPTSPSRRTAECRRGDVSTFGAAGGIAGSANRRAGHRARRLAVGLPRELPILGGDAPCSPSARSGRPRWLTRAGVRGGVALLGAALARAARPHPHARAARLAGSGPRRAPVLTVWYRRTGQPRRAARQPPGFHPGSCALALLAASVLSGQYLLAFFAQRALALSPGIPGPLCCPVGRRAAGLAARRSRLHRPAALDGRRVGFLLFGSRRARRNR